nr:uncharacterized protein [Tanacetum cinerariifolium]
MVGCGGVGGGGSRTVTKQGVELDGHYVFPYNPTLLKRYQAHINVEWCNQFGSIKYLFKYIDKGPDRVTATVEDDEKDEISDYYDCRYLSSCEAAWRIFRFDIHHRFPAVKRLPFHLPDQQSVVFDPSESIDFQLEKVSANSSKILAWMECNKTDTEVRKLLYVEFLKYYVGTKLINLDSKKASELEDVVYPTYKEACYARGLSEDDKEYIDGIIEASQWGMGDYLRNYFVMLIISDTMSMPEIVWENTWHLLAEDVLELERIKQNHPDNNKGGMFFVYGYEGTGKTFLYKTLTVAIRSKGGIVLNVASSGITLLLLDGGRTAHSWFVIPINIVEDSMCTIAVDGDLIDLIREAKLIIWDEALMINRLCYKDFDRTLRDITTDVDIDFNFNESLYAT